jgi:protein phosphatase 1L
MEDTFQSVARLGPSAAFFGVFDGHGGSHASAFVAEHLHRALEKRDFRSDPARALAESFVEVDEKWADVARENDWDDGTTAVAALVVDGVLYVANAGDSRAVLCSKGEAVAMSDDHKPNREDEKQRIQNAGGRIVFYGTWRVEGMLAVTRAIGDRKLKKYITAEPEIVARELTPDDSFLILASDGVWDTMSNQDACNIVLQSSSVRDAAERIAKAAYEKGSMDNTTALVVDLREYRKAGAGTSGGAATPSGSAAAPAPGSEESEAARKRK